MGLGKCPAGPSRREVNRVRRAQHALYRAKQKAKARARYAKSHPGKKSRRKKKKHHHYSAKSQRRHQQLQRDYKLIKAYRKQRDARKKCLRAHRHAQRTRANERRDAAAAKLRADAAAFRKRARADARAWDKAIEAARERAYTWQS